METLYCLSIKKQDEYHEHSVYTSFENALITIYDRKIEKLSLLEVLVKDYPHYKKEFEQNLVDLKELNSIRTDYEPDKVTYLFDKNFRITKIRSLLTSKVAFENIIVHINDRFTELKNMRTSKKICFPLQLLDEKVKNQWYQMDEYNAGEVIQHLEKHIQRRIDELKLQHSEVMQGILERNNEDFIAVRFTDSQEFLLNMDIFAITVSPNTGYNKSLTPT